ncbi:cyclic nucleotide-gated cation channel alpha-3-like protein, partial [Dinothrombium tinctorium]
SSLRSGKEKPGKIVKYQSYSSRDLNDDDLDEVAVISTNAAPENVRYGSGSITTVNGPRVVPGIITSSGGEKSRIFSSIASKDDKPIGGGGSKFCLDKKVIHNNSQHQQRSSTDNDRIRIRRKELRKEFDLEKKSGCNWSFVFDPSGRLCYYWSMIVSIAFLYNFWVIIYRFAFDEINEQTMSTWLLFDGIADFIYVLDIAVHFRTGYLEEGVLQTDGVKLRQHYMNSTMFYIDALCLLPLDFLYLSIGFNSILRCFRLVKIYRFWAFLDRTERHTNYPNLFRTISLTHYILVIFHWNACVYHLISKKDWFVGSRDGECSDVECDYLHAFYWSTLALTTIGDLPRPRTKREYLFLIIELVSGLFLLATVLGHVANIVTNVSAARKEFQAKLDAVKTYMRMRRVPEHLKIKVIKWFDYLWMTQKSSDEDKCVGFLPDTLKRVEIFQNTEAGFLCALVLRLKPVLFSPGDYVCRKGEVGKEMYIVNRGKLQVVNDSQMSVLATLRAGSYFGEISILNMGTAGNRRTASVRSVGYSDLFCLNKQDMWDVLKDYPAARVRLEAIAVKRLEKYRKEPLKKISMGRSKSTPGLVESQRNEATGEAMKDMKQMKGKVNTSASTATLLTEEKQQQPMTPPPVITTTTDTTATNTTLPMYAITPPTPLPSAHSITLMSGGGGGGLDIGSGNMSDVPCNLSCYPSSPDRNSLITFRAQSPLNEQELLVAEIKRLRERLITVEAENASMSIKLNQQQYQVDSRLAELELRLKSSSSPPLVTSCSSSSDDSERNKESII